MNSKHSPFGSMIEIEGGASALLSSNVQSRQNISSVKGGGGVPREYQVILESLKNCWFYLFWIFKYVPSTENAPWVADLIWCFKYLNTSLLRRQVGQIFTAKINKAPPSIA